MANLLMFLDIIKYKFSVLVLSETWENTSNSDDFCIPGYIKTSYYNDADRNGGVAIFTRENIVCEIRSDIKPETSDNFNSVFIEILNNYRQKITVGAIYRSPNRDIKK